MVLMHHSSRAHGICYPLVIRSKLLSIAKTYIMHHISDMSSRLHLPDSNASDISSLEPTPYISIDHGSGAGDDPSPAAPPEQSVVVGGMG